MNIALIFAGGTGQRMNTKSSPKQFLELHGKPIIIYTLEQFESVESIDLILVVCLESWIPFLEKKVKQFGVSKVAHIIPGGKTGFESIHRGITYLNKMYDGDSIVLVHDGVRPLISKTTIEDCVNAARRHGSAITVNSAIETIALENNRMISQIIDRSKAYIVRAPQCFILSDIADAHQKAALEQRADFIDSASLMAAYGYDLHIVSGNEDNIKITTPSDYYIFRAIVDARENAQIFGI